MEHQSQSSTDELYGDISFEESQDQKRAYIAKAQELARAQAANHAANSESNYANGTQTENQTEKQNKSQFEDEIEAGPLAQNPVEGKSESGIEASSEFKAKPEAETRTEAQTTIGTEAGTEADAAINPEAQGETNLEVETKTASANTDYAKVNQFTQNQTQTQRIEFEAELAAYPADAHGVHGVIGSLSMYNAQNDQSAHTVQTETALIATAPAAPAVQTTQSFNPALGRTTFNYDRASQESLLQDYEKLALQNTEWRKKQIDWRQKECELNNEIDCWKQQAQYFEHLYKEAMQQVQQLQESQIKANQSLLQVQNLQLAYRSLDNANQLLSSQNTALRTINQKLENDYRLKLAQYDNNSSEREERLKAVKEPFFINYTLHSCKKCPLGTSVNVEQLNSQQMQELDIPSPLETWTEIDWLNFIHGKLKDYGFDFPQRLLYAFHSSLKVAEWSPLTVLAGVSGTGKSELPRLYSLFGGFNFLNLPVQPSWDSQEALLGFFNPIDNKFDAQPLLRVLEQSQMPRNIEHPDGLKETCSLVLLDELNLAHVELYFAEFLSKFEQRRGLDDEHVPALEIKIGSGMAPERLALGRNVLWVGTMNEDETTKSLSDKVIDRGQIIHFPRPQKLQSRSQLKALPNTPLFNLPYAFWKEKFVDQPAQGGAEWFQNALTPYKETIQEINQHLGQVGRALGHRVWQSIESYMRTYPTVRRILQESGPNDNTTLANNPDLKRELSVAFEDQLVHKVMPKLRGIETRGASNSKCLEPIRNLLEEQKYSIIGDFEKAMKLGYGQFIWCSADYLNQQS